MTSLKSSCAHNVSQDALSAFLCSYLDESVPWQVLKTLPLQLLAQQYVNALVCGGKLEVQIYIKSSACFQIHFPHNSEVLQTRPNGLLDSKQCQS